MSKYRNIGYSVLGSGGAAGSLLASQSCLGACTGCLSCVAFTGVLVSMALVKTVFRTKGDTDGLAERNN